MMKTLQEIREKHEKLSVGLISGTSMDGVDAALVRITRAGVDAEIELLHFLTFPYPTGLKEKLLEISTPGRGLVNDTCQYNVLLGEIFARAVSALLEEAKVEPIKIDFIGSHGQTIQHLPGKQKLYGYTIMSTLQIGEPSVIAKRTGIITVADFRPADLAVGGQGAPLVPYLDFTVFRSLESSRIVLNIGGIANLTFLKRKCILDDVIAFDTGPGNMVIDHLMQKLYDLPFDKAGKVARSGNVSTDLLEQFSLKKFFHIKPPKSTGREDFGEVLSSGFLSSAEERGLTTQDIIATATELTVWSIAHAYKKFIEPENKIDEVIVSGGGAENKYLIEGLKKHLSGISIRTSDYYGIPSAAKEAVCFALLANETITGNPGNVPGATGASTATILGKICF